MSWFSVTEFQQYIDDLKIEVLQATDVNKLIDCIKRLNQKKNSYSKSDDSNNEMVIKGRASIFEKEIIARIDLFKQRTSVISALDNYIDEVQSLRIQKHFIDNTSYLDISEYDQHKLTYQPFLAKLQDKALTEILNGSSEQINNQLKRLQHIHERFQRFYSTLKDKPFLYKNLIYIDFVIHLSHIFRIDQLEEGILPYEFIHHLRDAVMHKQGSVYYLINQINAVITPETQHNISTTRRDDVNDSICKVPFIPAVIGSNFNISENILDAYYRLVPQPRSRKDISDSYIGKLHHYNAPFRVSVYGAYPLMIDWEDIEYKMKNFNDKTGYYKAYTRDNVFNAMKDFAKGFQFGFDNFLKEKVNTSLSLSNSESMKVQKVLDFLSSPLNKGGFSESSGSDKGPFEKWYDCGVKAGYLYFAWYLIIENHKLFEPFFSKNQAETTTEIIDSKIKIPDIPPIIPSTIDSLPPIEKVFFVHYQCDKFEEGDLITSLCVYDNIDIKVFQGDETKAIEAYCQKVNQLYDKELIPIHWGQNSPHFGVDHIKERYKILTGKEISLQYPGSLNLSDYLIFKHGENYVPHRRLDNLALLNNFSGVYETENSKKTFPRDRILLLSKIYLSEFKGNLITKQLNHDKSNLVKTISDHQQDIPTFQNPLNKMNKAQFLILVHEIKEQITDFDFRVQFIHSKFLEYGLSIENGYKAANFYYNEIRKARDGEQSIFYGKTTKLDNYFAISSLQGACIFEMTYVDFENLKKLFVSNIPLKPNQSLNSKQIMERDFFKHFLIHYFEAEVYEFDNKIKLLYVLCHSEAEKQNVTTQEIDKLKIIINDLGVEGLSWNMVQSYDPYSDYSVDINWNSQSENNINFWINLFSSDFCSQELSLTIIQDSYKEFLVAFVNDFDSNEELISEFWDIYELWKPEEHNITKIIKKEAELLHQINTDIENFNFEDEWEFNFDEYRRYIKFSIPMTIWFNYCDLLVSIDRLAMFKSFLSEPVSSEIDINLQNQKKKKTKPIKTFPEYFQHESRVKFAKAIKASFAKDTKTTLAVLVHTLRHEFENKPLLIVGSGEMKAFHNVMKEYFDGIAIGERTIYRNDIGYYRYGYDKDILGCKARINTILQSIEK